MKTLVSGIVSIDEKIQDEARDGFYVASQNIYRAASVFKKNHFMNSSGPVLTVFFIILI